MTSLRHMLNSYPLYRAGMQVGLFMGFFIGVGFVSVCIVAGIIIGNWRFH